jgi:hypothetical protein
MKMTFNTPPRVLQEKICHGDTNHGFLIILLSPRKKVTMDCPHKPLSGVHAVGSVFSSPLFSRKNETPYLPFLKMP